MAVRSAHLRSDTRESITTYVAAAVAGPSRGPGVWLHAVGVGLSVAAFAADVWSAHDVASGVLYVAVVGLTAWLPGLRATLTAGGIATVLTVAGYMLSPPADVLWAAVANRLLAVFAIWIVVTLVWHHKGQTARLGLAESSALRSEQQFRSIVESSPTGMLLVDRQGRIALVNREAERLFGHARRELLGQSMEILVPAQDRGEHAAQQALFQAGAAPRRMGGGREVRGLHRDGHELMLEVGLARIETTQGEFVLASVVDVGDRKRLDQARDAHALTRRLREAEEAQRKRMARDIHDALGQSLTALKLDIGWLAGHLANGDASLHERAIAMEELATRTMQEVRRLSAELRPAVLDDQGLLAAIRWLAGDFERRTTLPCSLALPAEEVGWSDECCTAAFRVLQESLTNVLRHARARNVTVALWTELAGDAVLEVRDDGRGIGDADAARPDGLGLLGMRERAVLHDGTLTVCGVAGAGTTVTLRMPCRPDPAASGGRPGVGATRSPPYAPEAV